jgi:hypothetical protein
MEGWLIVLQRQDGVIMKRVLYTILILVSLVGGCNAQVQTFEITAKIDQASLSDDFYRKIGTFVVEVTIKNVSSTVQTISIWTNPDWSWVTDSKDVITNQAASKNFPTSITLKPLEIYRGDVRLGISKGKRPITFRLGFIPNATVPVHDARDTALVWSNSVDLTE